MNSLSSSLSPYANPNTDAAMRLRVTAATTGDIAEGTALCVVRFGTEFKYRGGDGVLVPFQPVVQVHSRKHAVYADNITSMGFALFSDSPIAAGRTLNVFISTSTGVMTES